MSLRGAKVFVTGATGFIGGRLVERLVLEEGAEVVALVRHFKRASRLARFPVKMVAGDIMDLEGMTRAMAGCGWVVHCAMDSTGTPEQSQLAIIEGTRNVCQAAQLSKVQRLVHLSTISVYGRTPAGNIDETTAKNPGKDPYGASKLVAENLVLEFSKGGLSCVVLQPTVVFGPWAHWSVSIAALLAAGTVVLPNDGQGLCNAVYVDDVVSAVFCALEMQSPKVGPYLISAESPVSWADYYRAYGRWIPGSAIAGEPLKIIEKRNGRQKFVGSIAPALFPGPARLKISRTLQNFPGLWQVYNTARGRRTQLPTLALGADPIIQPNTAQRVYPSLENARFMALGSRVSINRAKTELRFKPAFDLATAMEVVGPWLQWAGFAPR